MKKRLLITSIVMMLVVAVALSTATYAWFTSSATVTANTLSLTAATNQSSALGISYQNDNYTTTITADSFTAEQQPMAPAALTVGTTEDSVTFFTGTIKSVSGDMVFGTVSDVDAPHFATFSSSSVIYLKNLSTSNAIATVPVTADITDTKGWLRAAIFVYDGSSKYLLKGVFGIDYTKASANSGTYDAGATYYTYNSSTHSYDLVASNNESNFSTYYVKGLGKAVYGAKPDAGDSVATFETNKRDCVDSITVATNLAAGGVVQVKVLLWTDGTALNDNTQGGSGSISLTFGQ